MLRRLLGVSSAAPAGPADQPVDEPREYIMLSKMQPFAPAAGRPPSAMANGGCPLSSYWPQAEQPHWADGDMYWPNYACLDQSLLALSSSTISSLVTAPPLPAPVPPPVPQPHQPAFVLAQPVGTPSSPAADNQVHSLLNSQMEPDKEEEKDSLSLSPIGGDRQQTTAYLGELAGYSRDRKQQPEKSPDSSLSAEAINERQQDCVCPFCGRFISLGNLRRHTAQCRRLKGLPPANHQQQSGRLGVGKLASAANGHSAGPAGGSVKDKDKLPKSAWTSSQSPASVDPSDPYQCRWCQFNTLYKGNMKRHLVCCHQVSADFLRRVCFDVERLRKSASNRPQLAELPIMPRRDEANRRKTDDFAETGANGEHKERD